MKHAILVAGIATLCFAAPATAQEPDGETSHLNFGVTAGSLGIGPEIGYRISRNIGVRASATFLGISRGYDSDDVQYHGKVRLQSFGAMLDLFPFGGAFRLSGGLRVGGNRIQVDATPTGETDIGNGSYSPAQIGTLTARAKPARVAPAFTIGTGGGTGKGFFIGAEGGVLLQGRFRVTDFTASGGAVSKADLDMERASLQQDIDALKIWPIAQIKLGYRF